jgi:hypothetical protein
MYTLHSASLPPYQAELSRRAAERYALLTAVKEQRRAKRHASRRQRVVPDRAHALAMEVAPVSPRC